MRILARAIELAPIAPVKLAGQIGDLRADELLFFGERKIHSRASYIATPRTAHQRHSQRVDDDMKLAVSIWHDAPIDKRKST